MPVAVLAEVVTATSTLPTAWAGVVAVMLVALFTVKLFAATPPKVTAVAPVNAVPVRITLVPPEVLPVAGEILVRVGGVPTVVKLKMAPDCGTVFSALLASTRK